jgi:hypothetical protein
MFTLRTREVAGRFERLGFRPVSPLETTIDTAIGEREEVASSNVTWRG